MKIRLVLLLGLLAGLAMQAQDIDISGDWSMYEMIWTSGDEVNKTTEEQMNAQEMVSEYSFMPDGNLKLVSNMTGSEKMETVEGTWKLEGDKLTCGFSMQGNPVDIVWDFEYRDDCIHLKRTSPDGNTSVVNSFKRK